MKFARSKKMFKEDRFQWLFLLLILVTAYGIFMYGDITDTIDNSLIFIKAVFHGDILNFYELSVQQARFSYSANYSLMLYVIFAVWNLPAYIIAGAAGKNFLTWPVTLLWSKTLLVFFAAAAAYMIYKIVRLCRDDEKMAYLAVFLFLSSMALFYPVFITAQLDIIALFFMLLGLWGYLKDKRILFFAAFMIAAPCKMFAILMALPLILLREKNLIKAAGLWCLTMSLNILEKIMFWGSPVYQAALSSQSRDAIDQLLGSKIEVGNPVIIFVFCYICLLVYCYLHEKKNSDIAVYGCFFLWGTFVASVSLNTYWIVLMIPFCAMNIAMYGKYQKTCVLLETIGSFSFFLYITSSGTLIFKDTKLVSRLLLPFFYNVPGKEIQKYGTLVQLFQNLHMERYTSLFSTVFVTSIVLILILTFPKLSENKIIQKTTKGLLLLRVALLYLATSAILYAFLAVTNPIAYTNLNMDESESQVDLLEEENVVSQKIQFQDSRKLDELILKFQNPYFYRNNMALMNVEILDLSTEQCFFQTSIGASLIEDQTEIRIHLKNTAVKTKKSYEIRISGTKGVQAYEGIAHLYPVFSTNEDSGLEPVQVNGKKQIGSLCFQIR